MEEWKQKKSEGAAKFKNGDWRGSLDSFQSSLTALRTQVGASNRHSRDIAVVSGGWIREFWGGGVNSWVVRGFLVEAPPWRHS
jgi:hypothetical protein